MHYRPITEHNFSEINYPVFTISGWQLLLGLLCVSIQVWSLSCLEANCANSLRPKICPNTPHRAHGQHAILSKNYGKRSWIAKFQRNLQDSDQKACPNPQVGIVLIDCKSIGPEPL